MKVSILQMEVKIGDIEANMRAVEEGVAVIVREQSPDVVVLPELWNTGFVPKVAAQLAAGHSDDTAICTSEDEGWGWLMDRGYDIIQTDWTLPLKLYMDRR